MNKKITIMSEEFENEQIKDKVERDYSYSRGDS
jgi:hypothetical protein